MLETDESVRVYRNNTSHCCISQWITTSYQSKKWLEILHQGLGKQKQTLLFILLVFNKFYYNFHSLRY